MQAGVKGWLCAGALTIALSIVAGGCGLMSAGAALAGTAPGNACNPHDGKVEGRGADDQIIAQMLWWNAYESDVCGTTTTSDPSGNDMGQYGYDLAEPAATVFGSGAGWMAANCRTDAYAGTSIPYTTNQLVDGLDGPPGASVSGLLDQFGLPCDAGIPEQLYFPPDPTSNSRDEWPNPADATADVMSFPVAGSAVTVDANLNSSDCNGMPTGALDLTGAQIAQLLGGDIFNWDDAALRDNGENAWLANCDIPLVRVVRYDDSGTTNILKAYLENAAGADNCDYWGDPEWSLFAWPGVSNDQGDPPIPSMPSWDAGSNNVWPTDGTASSRAGQYLDYGATQFCSRIQSASGGESGELQELADTPGGIGYADLPDEELDTGPLPVGTKGLFRSVLIRASVESATQPGSYLNAANIKGSNCEFDTLSIPGGGTPTAMVGLDLTTSGYNATDTWAVDNGIGNHEDATDEGALYPICGLTFDLVYAGLSTPQPGTAGGGPSAIVDLTNDQRRTLYSYIVVQPVLRRPVAAVDGLLPRAALRVAAVARVWLRDELLNRTDAPSGGALGWAVSGRGWRVTWSPRRSSCLSGRRRRRGVASVSPRRRPPGL